MLNRSGDVRTCIIAAYDIGSVSSRRNRQPHEQQILNDQHASCSVFELVGALAFATIEYLSRRLSETRPHSQFVILDFGRVATITKAGAKLLADSLADLTADDVTVILCGMEQEPAVGRAIARRIETIPKIRRFALLDEAMEWAEDQIIYRYGGYAALRETTALKEQALLAGLTADEIAALAGLMQPRTYQAGRCIIAAGENSSSVFFIESGMVSVKLPSGARLATLTAGMVVGEMALLEEHRSADVWADTSVRCLELPLAAYFRFRDQHPQIGERIVRNLAVLLAKRLILANTKIELLTSY
jgi:glutaminase